MLSAFLFPFFLFLDIGFFFFWDLGVRVGVKKLAWIISAFVSIISSSMYLPSLVVASWLHDLILPPINGYFYPPTKLTKLYIFLDDYLLLKIALIRYFWRLALS